MNISDAVLIGGLILILLLVSWGFVSLMAAIGKVRGWDTKRVFWGSAVSYGLIVAAWGIVTNAGTSAGIVPPSGLLLTLIYRLLLLIGALSPLEILVIRRAYPAAFKKTTSSTIPPIATQREPAPAKHQPSSVDPRPAASPVVHPRVTTGSAHIFVSYRRSDSADIAGRIYDRLIGKFGKDPIFKDVDSIPLGLDFKEYLDRKVGECDVLLAIIGDRWLEASDSTGKHRLDDPSDFVRIEIQSALERGIPVIPLLVRDAHIPPEESLPSGLRKLVYRNGIPIRSDPDFHRDMDRLIAALEKYVREDK